MQFQRISAAEVLILAPLETAREAAWYALKNERIPSPLIDVEQNLVSGSRGDGVLTPILIATVTFQSQLEGTLVSFESKPAVGGKDIGARGRAKKLASMFERVLNSGHFATPGSVQAQAPAPLAEPSGAGSDSIALVGQPVYGLVLAPKRGTTLLTNSLVSLLCCQILLPFTLIYGLRTLKDYERQGDPGDRRMVIASIAVCGAGLLIIFVLLLLLL